MTATDPHHLSTDPDPAAPHITSTGTRATRVLGILTVISMVWLVAFGLGFSPADRDQEEAVRLLYVHVPTIWIAYLAFVVTAVASGLYLFTKKHSLGWDRLAGASAEVGVVKQTGGSESAVLRTCSSPLPPRAVRPRTGGST